METQDIHHHEISGDWNTIYITFDKSLIERFNQYTQFLFLCKVVTSPTINDYIFEFYGGEITLT